MSVTRRLRLLPPLLVMLFFAFPLLDEVIAIPPDTCTEVIFYSDDHEGTTQWTSLSDYNPPTSTLVAWSLNTGVSSSGTHHWFANNYGVTTEARLTSPTITIPLGATDEIFLRFSHRFDTEQGVDGGVVEVNVNGGGFNDVGVSNFSQNPYNRTLSGGTILGIRDAFSAQSDAYPNYISSIVDLGGLASASDDIQIQFHFATSDNQSGVGWFVDDVELGYCALANTPPVASDVTSSTAEDTTLNGTVTATDADSDPLTFSGDTPPSNGTVIVNPDGSFTYTPNANYNGADSFTVLVSDGNGGTDVATVTITITAVNDPPSFTLAGNPPAINEDAGAQTINGFASNISAGPSDESSQILTFGVSITGTTGNLAFTAAPSIDPATGDLTYNPAPNTNGTGTVQVVLSDNGGGTDTSAPQIFTITVNSINDPPVANDLNTTTSEDTPLSDTVTATDAENDLLVFVIGTLPTNGIAIVNTNGSFTYTPNTNYVGGDSFTIVVNDGNGGTDTATVSVNVVSTNDNPVVDAGTDQTININVPTGINAVYTDADAGDTHTATIDWGDGSPTENSSAVAGNVSGTHAYTSSGNYTVTVTVTDNNGGSASDTLIVNVNAPTVTPTPTSTSTPTNTPDPVNTATLTPTPSSSPTTSIIPNATLDAPPPAPLAADVNSDPNSIVRVGIPDRLRDDIYVRVIVANGNYLEWLGREVTNGGNIGIQSILDMGVQQAVDIFSPTGLRYFYGGIVICLYGEGRLVYLNANHAPRTAEIVGSYTVPEFPGFTCVTLFEPGTLILVNRR